MNEEYSFRPEYEYRAEYPAPPDEYDAKSTRRSFKKKKLAQLMLYSWIMVMLGGTAAAVTSAEEPCHVTVYDAAGSVVVDETLSESELEALRLPHGTYLLSEGGDEVLISDEHLSSDVIGLVPPSDDGARHIELHPSK